MSHFKHLKIAQEAIDFQSGTFFKELALALSPYVGQSNISKDAYSKLSTLLNKIINRHTGISASVGFTHMGTHVLVPDIDGSNPMVVEWAETLSSNDGFKIIKAAGGRDTGRVNINKSEVRGVFSKPIVKIGVEYGLFSTYGMTAEEIAAIILHEVGHYFVYCEMMDKTTTNNLIMFGLDQALRQSTSPKEREMAIERAGAAVGFERTVVEDLKKNTNDKNVVTIFVTESNQALRTSSGHSFYDINSFEMAADQFAARHGAGRHLVTGLDKLYADSGVGRTTKFNYYLMQVASVVAILLGLAAGIAGFVVGQVHFGIFFLLISWGALTSAHTFGGAPTYDKPLDRAMRLRRQLVEQSKQSNLPKEIVQSLIKDVALIDETVKDYSRQTGWLESIDNFLFRSSRRRADNVQLQKDLERLAINDLFLQSSELKHL